MQYVVRRGVQKFAAFASIAIVATTLAVPYVSAQGSDSATTTINAQLCVGGVNTPSGTITAPVSGTVVGQSTQTLDVTTSWVRAYDVYRGSTLLTSNNTVPYVANATTTVTVGLELGDNTLHLVLYGGCPETSTNSTSITLTYTQDSATIKPITTNKRSPTLKGFVSRADAVVTVTVNGKTYTAQNNGDGTWTLPEGVIDSLASGTYDVLVTITDRAGNISTYTYQITISASDEVGFILSPNTGYLRINKFNIPSLAFYSIAALLLLAILITAALKLLSRREGRRSTV